MFIVKDPDLFAKDIIPQYFDHNKFSSFARQLNFYGFRKMQSKPIKNSDFDADTAKHVTFYNINFKRGRTDLLKKIQRSTRGGGANNGQDQTREIQQLREQVALLQQALTETSAQMEERIRQLELDMLGRMEQMMLAMQQQQQIHLQLQSTPSIGSNGSSADQAKPNASQNVSHSVTAPSGVPQQQTWEPNALSLPAREASIGGLGRLNSVTFQQPPNNTPTAGPTLPPHPKQKLSPVNGFPGAAGMPQGRLDSLRGLSALSRGLSGLSRGASVDSNASAVLMRNSWEDKFFSMLMLEENNKNVLANNGLAANNVLAAGGVQTQPDGNMTATGAIAPGGTGAPVTISEESQNDLNSQAVAQGGVANGVAGLNVNVGI